MIQDGKKNDLLLNVLANPEYTMTDFVDVGVNSSNSTLKSADEYKNDSRIRTNPEFLKNDGTFDESKFDKFYNGMVGMYNQMSTMDYNDMVLNEIESDPYDIFSSPESKKKDLDDEVKLIEFGKDIPMMNPDRMRFSVSGIGKMDENKWTPQELAQMSERYNPETGKFEESPETWFSGDKWHSNLFKTTVMATYEEDDEEVKKGLAKVGQYKLNDEGTYYTEFLDGRSTYNKEIISKLDLLTKEDSWINKYDFFDSDDKEKGIFGTVLKNVVTVAPMFVPHIGGYYTAMSIANQLGGLAASVSKIFVGSDNEFVNDMDGFFSQFRTGTSQYGKEHAFSIENFVNMFGQVVSQIKEQRWIFKNASFYSKDKFIEDANELKSIREAFSKKNFDTYLDKIKKGDYSYREHIFEMSGGRKDMVMSSIKAEAEKKADLMVDIMQKNAQKTGSMVSRIYMTGITSADLYNQAKAEGASDNQAALLTLGYAAAEFGLLSSDIGQWIFPELKLERQKIKQSVKTLFDAEDKALKAGTRSARNLFAGRAIKEGMNLYENIILGSNGKAIFAGAMAEGIEETTEEILADLTKSIFNVSNWIAGDDLRYTTFDNMAERYGMSLIGGAAGGGFTVASGMFKNFRNGIENEIKTKEQAMEYIAYSLRNNGKNSIMKAIDSVTFMNPNLSTEEAEVVATGIDFKSGTIDNNQDLEVKSAIKGLINMYDSLLSTSGLDINDDETIRRAVNNNTIYSLISKSLSASSYVSDFNSAIREYAKAKMDYDSIKRSIYAGDPNTSITDSMNRREISSDDMEKLKRAEDNVRFARENAQAYINGKNSGQLMLKAIFELNPELHETFKYISLESYIKSRHGKDISSLDDNKIAEYKIQYNNFINSTGKDYLNESFSIFMGMLNKMNPYITSETDNFYNSIMSNNEIIKSLDFINSEFNEISNKVKEIENFGAPDEIMFERLSDLASNNVLSINEKEGNISLSGIGKYDFLDRVFEEYKKSKSIKTLEDYAKGEAVPDGTVSNSELYNSIIKDSVQNTEFALFIKDYFEKYKAEYLNKFNDAISNIAKMPYVDIVTKKEIADRFNNLFELIIGKKYEDFINESEHNYTSIYNANNAIEWDDTNEGMKVDLNPLSGKITLKDIVNMYESANGIPLNSVFDNYTYITGSDGFPDNVSEVDLNNLSIISNIKDNIDKLMTTPNTPALEIIDKMGFLKEGEKSSELYNEIIDTLQSSSKNVRSFTLTSEQEKSIRRFQNYSMFLMSMLNAMRDNNRSIMNPVSFIDTVNKFVAENPDFGWGKMNTISGESARAMSAEVNKISNIFDTFLAVSKMNDGNKTSEIRNLEVNMGILKYKTLNEMIDFLKSMSIDNEDTKRFESAMKVDIFSKLKEIDEDRENKSLKIPDDDLVKMYSAINKAEVALYNIYQNNKDLLNGDNLVKLISRKSVIGDLDDRVNSTSNSFSSANSIWYIASVVAMDPYLKHSMVSSVYKQKDLLPNSLQIHSAELASTFIINRDVFKRFSNSFKTVVDSKFNDMLNKNNGIDEVISTLNKVGTSLSPKDFSNMDKEEFIKYAKLAYQNTGLYNAFDSIMFIEGIPGSGKTSAILKKLVNRILTSKDKDGNYYIKDLGKLSSNIYLITTEGMKDTFFDDSDKLFDSDDKPKIMTHEDFLVEAFGISDKGNINNDFINNSMIGGNDGTNYSLQYTKDDVFGSTIPAPSIILIDEVTLYNHTQVSAINNIAQKYDIPVVAFGDTDQVQNSEKFIPKIHSSLSDIDIDKIFKSKKDGKPNTSFIISKGQFVSSPKIGVCMRSNNNHITSTINDFMYKMDHNADNSSKKIINSHYYRGTEGFFGIKFSNSVSEIKNMSDFDRTSIHSMIKEIEDGVSKEKIGYIGTEDSLEKLADEFNIPKEKISNYFDRFGTAKDTIGMERKYYIINSKDFDNIESAEPIDRYNAYHELYTAISRIKQGAIVFAEHKNSISNIEDKLLSLSKFNQNDIDKYSEKFSDIYATSLEGNVDTVESIEIFGNSKNEPNDKKDSKDTNDVIIAGQNDKDGDIFIDNDGETNKEKKSSEKNEKLSEKIKEESGNIIDESVDFIGYTFNMFELGKDFKINDDGIQLRKFNMDSLNGIFNFVFNFAEDSIIEDIKKDNQGKSDALNISYKIIKRALKNDISKDFKSDEEIKRFITKEVTNLINKLHHSLTYDLFDINGNPKSDKISPFINTLYDFVSKFNTSIKNPEDIRNILIGNSDSMDGSSLYLHKFSKPTQDGSNYNRFYVIDNNDSRGTYAINYDSNGISKVKDNARTRISYIAKFKSGIDNEYLTIEIPVATVENFITMAKGINDMYNTGIDFTKSSKETDIDYAKRIEENLIKSIKGRTDIGNKDSIINKIQIIATLYKTPNHILYNLKRDNNDTYGLDVLSDMVVKGPDIVSNERESYEVPGIKFVPGKNDVKSISENTGLFTSYPMVVVNNNSTNDNIKKLIADGYIKPGYPFVILYEGDRNIGNDNDYMKGYIEQCLNSSSRKVKKFRVLYVNMPSFEIGDYIEKIANIVSGKDMVSATIDNKSFMLNNDVIGDVFTTLNIINRAIGYDIKDNSPMSFDDFKSKHESVLSEIFSDVNIKNIDGKTSEDILKIIYSSMFEVKDDMKNDEVSNRLDMKTIAENLFSGDGYRLNYLLLVFSGKINTVNGSITNSINRKFVDRIVNNGFKVVYAPVKVSSNDKLPKLIDGLKYIKGVENKYSLSIGENDFNLTYYGKITPSVIYLKGMNALNGLKRKIDDILESKENILGKINDMNNSAMSNENIFYFYGDKKRDTKPSKKVKMVKVSPSSNDSDFQLSEPIEVDESILNNHESMVNAAKSLSEEKGKTILLYRLNGNIYYIAADSTDSNRDAVKSFYDGNNSGTSIRLSSGNKEINLIYNTGNNTYSVEVVEIKKSNTNQPETDKNKSNKDIVDNMISDMSKLFDSKKELSTLLGEISNLVTGNNVKVYLNSINKILSEDADRNDIKYYDSIVSNSKRIIKQSFSKAKFDDDLKNQKTSKLIDIILKYKNNMGTENKNTNNNCKI